MIQKIIVFLLIALFIGLSQTAGVGGGPIVNISLMMSMDYDAKLSISVTYIFLIGGSIASVWKNLSKINPQTKQIYTNFDLVMLSLPIMSSGSLFGGAVKHFASQLVITIAFCLLFGFIFFDLNKALKKMREVSDQKLITIKNVQNIQGPNSVLLDELSNKQINENKAINTLKLCGFYYVYTLVLSLIRGGSNFDSIIGLNPCGFFGWIVLFIHLGTSIYLSLRTCRNIIRSSQEGDLSAKATQISEESAQYFIIAAFFAGLVGATLAIGGSLILIPVWLKAGIDKDVAAGTTAPLILTAALVAFTIALFNGSYEQVSSLLMIFYLALSFTGSAVVKQFLTFLTNKYKIKSLVLILLLIVIVISMLAMIPYQLSKFIDSPDDFVEFGQFC